MKNAMTKTERRRTVTREFARFLELLGITLIDDGEGGRMTFRHEVTQNHFTENILFEYQRSQMSVCHGEPRNSDFRDMADELEAWFNKQLDLLREKYDI